MKNLVLALLLALGVSTVANAATEIAAEEATLEQIVQDAEQANPGFINWMKAHPALTTAAAVVAGSAIAYGVFVAKNYTKFDKDVEGTGFVAALKAPAVDLWNGVDRNFTKAKGGVENVWNNTIKANPKTSIACGVGAVVFVAVLVDLMNKGGYIRTAYDNATAEVANEVAAVEAN